jgi:hypothetical protein
MNVTSQGVIFTVPQICAYFVDNLHNLEIDSFKIAASEHISLFFKNSNSLFLVRDKIIDCLYVYLLYFLCATHDLLFLFSCYFIRDACTAV